MGRIGRLVQAVIGAPTELPPGLAARFPELREARYRRGGLPPRIGGWCLGTTTVAAITLRRTIWLAPAEPWSAALLLHELRHVHQFGATFGFPFRYIWETVRRGYFGNRFEIDAREFAALRLRGADAHPPTEDV